MKQQIITLLLLTSIALTSSKCFSNEAQEQKPLVINDFNMALVAVKDLGNKADDEGHGAVNRSYQIGKYEVTVGQYATFLNAVAWKEDAHALYHPEMETDKKIACIARVTNDDGTYSYEVLPGRENLPITYVNLNDAKRFCNWMENGSPAADFANFSTEEITESGAYSFSLDENGQEVVKANSDALYHIPSEDEWFKAAYYKGNGTNSGYWTYPTQHDAAPSSGIGDVTNQANYKTFGSRVSTKFLDTDLAITAVDSFNSTVTSYGACDMGGNVAEWTVGENSSDLATIHGGSWKSEYSFWNNNDLMRNALKKVYDPSQGSNFIGFRIAYFGEETASAWNDNISGVTPGPSDSDWYGELEKKLSTPDGREQFFTNMFSSGTTLVESAALFIGGELAYDCYAGMSSADIQKSFTGSRIAITAAHILMSSMMLAAASSFPEAGNVQSTPSNLSWSSKLKKSFSTPGRRKAFLENFLSTAGTLISSSAISISGEIGYNVSFGGIAWNLIKAETFPEGRLLAIAAHLLVNTTLLTLNKS